jgi:hypothetical protein
MPDSDKRDEYLESLDEPRHALEYGGVNERATIRGVPVPVGPSEEGHYFAANKNLGVVLEPVPVLLRDAVTLDTATRLTGCARATLQHGAKNGSLPVLKLGPGSSPYLVRLRDVFTYLITMYTEQRARAERPEGPQFLGFPEWLVREVSESWPDRAAFKPGHWQGGPVKINRGGRPRGYSPGKGFSRNGVRLGRPPGKKPEAEGIPVGENSEAPEGNHPPAPAEVVAVVAEEPAPPPDPQVDVSRLPKWHPLWRRPGS